MRKVRILVAVAAVAAVAGLVAALVLRGRPLPDGPVDLVWNREPCAHCRMLVGEPAYAAQLVTTSGDVLAFDDPGCLLHYVEDQRPDVHRIWFHDSTSDRWLSPEEVGFAPGAATPMDYGLAAVPAGTPGAISLDDARRRLP
ncbi:MAG: hypothetical protein K8M05_26395 [Deltaproteobacteria bacterium]|nr:hypothetical protein [Kofleriaceae bacterium]